MVLWDTSLPSSLSAGFLNKASIPCPNTSSLDLLACRAANSTSLDSVTGPHRFPVSTAHDLYMVYGIPGLIATEYWSLNSAWPSTATVLSLGVEDPSKRIYCMDLQIPSQAQGSNNFKTMPVRKVDLLISHRPLTHWHSPNCFWVSQTSPWVNRSGLTGQK